MLYGSADFCAQGNRQNSNQISAKFAPARDAALTLDLPVTIAHLVGRVKQMVIELLVLAINWLLFHAIYQH